MSELELTASVRVLRGVGPARAAQLEGAGCWTVADLLHHLPRKYLLWCEEPWPPAASVQSRPACLRGELRSIRTTFGRGRRRIVRARFCRDEHEISVLWFNRPYLESQLSAGSEIVLTGELRQRGEAAEMINPAIRTGADEKAPRIEPTYPTLGGLGGGVLRKLVLDAIERVGEAEVEPSLPPVLRGAVSVRELFRELHLPDAKSDIDALNALSSPAHRALIRRELVEQQLLMALLRARRGDVRKPRTYLDPERLRELLEPSTEGGILPFELTAAQRRVSEEILEDLATPQPMMRLIQGDVGCGKTVVAAIAMEAAVRSGYQAGLMAPTELLARQQYRSIQQLLPDRSVALLTGQSTDGAEVREELAKGSHEIVVGTHALFQESTTFRELGLIVIDEQHRFGVLQRQALARRGESTDVLVMTATPIPRSLALTFFGDLSVSIIDELPGGRLPVETTVAPRSAWGDVLDSLRERLAQGERAFVVFPMIDVSDGASGAALLDVGRRLLEALSPVPGALLHGRLSADERTQIMESFVSGEIQVLASTTIVEVGVDVAEATMMIVDTAERFGLAQLHQLRGRVGRGTVRSSCWLLHSSGASAASLDRLATLAATADGFEIAEADLRIRGPGEVLGVRQAGTPTFRSADLERDLDLLVEARDRVAEWVRAASSQEKELWLSVLSARSAAREIVG